MMDTLSPGWVHVILVTVTDQLFSFFFEFWFGEGGLEVCCEGGL